MITLFPYDPAWPATYAVEAARLRHELGGLACRVEHVGSTSVPGLAAKPVIDIQVSVMSLATLAPFVPALERLGYQHVSYGDLDDVYPFFAKPVTWPRTFHVHLCAAGGEQEARHLAFRNFLRDHGEVALAYLALKRELAALHHGTTAESRERYATAKSSFIQGVQDRARAAGYFDV